MLTGEAWRDFPDRNPGEHGREPVHGSRPFSPNDAALLLDETASDLQQARGDTEGDLARAAVALQQTRNHHLIATVLGDAGEQAGERRRVHGTAGEVVVIAGEIVGEGAVRNA